MKLILTTLACAALLAAQPPSVPTPPAVHPETKADPNAVVLTIGDRHFTAAQYEQMVKSIVPAQVQSFALGPGKRSYSQKIIEMLVLSAEAGKQHLDQRPATAAQLELQRRTTLSVQEFRKIASEIPVTDAQVQAFYDANHPLYTKIHVREILVRFRGSMTPPKPGKPDLTENEGLQKAKALRQRILAGEDFAKVAREESDDKSAAAGGDIGEIGHGRTPPQFEAAAFALKDGDLSEPVRTQFGYHIIQVQSRSVQPLAEARNDIEARLRQAAAPAVVKGLIDKAGYHFDEKYFGPDPAAAAAIKPPAAPAPK